jgi:hypothetical protein
MAVGSCEAAEIAVAETFNLNECANDCCFGNLRSQELSEHTCICPISVGSVEARALQYYSLSRSECVN